MLSINQLIAYTTAMTTFKIRQSKEPIYLAKRMGLHQSRVEGYGHALRNPHNLTRIDFDLSTAREGYFYRSGLIWSSMPLALKQETHESHFENLLMQYIQEKIPAIP